MTMKMWEVAAWTKVISKKIWKATTSWISSRDVHNTNM